MQLPWTSFQACRSADSIECICRWLAILGWLSTGFKAGDMYRPLFLPMQDLDTVTTYPQKRVVLQTHVTHILEAESLQMRGLVG